MMTKEKSKAGRPPKRTESVRISHRVKPETQKWIEEEAEKLGCTGSEFLDILCQAYQSGELIGG